MGCSCDCMHPANLKEEELKIKQSNETQVKCNNVDQKKNNDKDEDKSDDEESINSNDSERKAFEKIVKKNSVNFNFTFGNDF